MTSKASAGLRAASAPKSWHADGALEEGMKRRPRRAPGPHPSMKERQEVKNDSGFLPISRLTSTVVSAMPATLPLLEYWCRSHL